ncbi:MAG: thiamine pyrophosphate-binding protein [Thermodesulfobacteriota bacterium]|nr:thiamine pyrophosphate-binding protein [Thermodesulfobacteriota bacterium]
MKIKLSDYIFNFLSHEGIKDVFLLPGGGCMHLVDSLGQRKEINHTCFLHEQAAVIAAEAYGQYTNRLGVALVTTGPGSTNAITGVTGAWIDSTPLLVLSGQVKRQDQRRHTGVRQMGIQEVDIIPMVSSVTKYAQTVIEPQKIKYHLQKALHLATTGRKGPVWLDIPLDIQGSVVDDKNLASYEIPTKPLDSEDMALHAKQTLELLALSKRPVILVGNGVRLSRSEDELNRLVNRLNIPVLTTWKASDLISEAHPLYCGKPGTIGQRGANFVQQTSDWIMCLGARLDLCQVAHNYPNFAPKAKKVIVDIDDLEIKKLRTFGMPIDVKVHADSGDFLTLLNHLIEEEDLKDFTQWVNLCREWKRRYPVVLPEYKHSGGLINTYAFVDVLSEVLKEDDLIVPGSSGACAEIVQQAYRVKEGQRLLNTPGLGAMGFGLPASIGACLASGKRRTISIIGDGGLQHNIQELETLSRLQLPIKIFILNNSGYGSIKAMQENHFDGRYVCCNSQSGLTLPDICSVARAYGLKTTRIKSQKNLNEKVAEVIETKGTIICDLLVDPDIPTSPRVSSHVLPDGRIISKPMEDLWPFLERNEFDQNMRHTASE